jgi:hypothetical protein
MGKFAGDNAEIEFDGTFVTLRPIKGVLGFIKDGGRGERRLAVRSIVMVEFAPATALKPGYLRLLTAGMTPLRGTPMRPAFMDATRDPNALLFKQRHAAGIAQIRNEIDLAIAGS